MNYDQPALIFESARASTTQGQGWDEVPVKLVEGNYAARPDPGPGRERRCRVIWILFVLVPIVVVGYALGAIVWLGLIPWGRW